MCGERSKRAEGCVEGAAAEHTHTGGSCDIQKAIVV